MSEGLIDFGDVTLNVRIDGPENADAPTVMFSNGLGTTLAMWDPIVPLLPPGLRLVRYDTRGHGQSPVPPGPYAMGALIRDAEAVADMLNVRDAALVGLSMGGLVAQGLAVKRPDVVRTLVLSNTGVRIGNRQMWEDRIAQVRAGGIEAIADGLMSRWFSRAFLAGPEAAAWRRMLTGTPVEGYVACCAAIAGADFLAPTSGLRLPTLAIAGSEDGATPPDLVREMADLIPGARFHLIRGAGHLPQAEAPAAYAAVLTEFLEATGHLAPP